MAGAPWVLLHGTVLCVLHVVLAVLYCALRFSSPFARLWFPDFHPVDELRLGFRAHARLPRCRELGSGNARLHPRPGRHLGDGGAAAGGAAAGGRGHPCQEERRGYGRRLRRRRCRADRRATPARGWQGRARRGLLGRSAGGGLGWWRRRGGGDERGGGGASGDDDDHDDDVGSAWGPRRLGHYHGDDDAEADTERGRLVHERVAHGRRAAAPPREGDREHRAQ